MNILYISWRAPYSSVSHAGGKTFNYYIKGIAKNTNNNILVVMLLFASFIINIINIIYLLKK